MTEHAGWGVTRLDEIPLGYDRAPDVARIRHVREHLGIAAFGATARLAERAGQVLVVAHRESSDSGLGTEEHEELYVVLRGHASFTIGGATADAPGGTLVFVRDPSLERAAVALEDGTALLCIGAPRGRPFQVAAWEQRVMEQA